MSGEPNEEPNEVEPLAAGGIEPAPAEAGPAEPAEPIGPACVSAPPSGLPVVPAVIDVQDLDWASVRAVVDAPAIRARMRDTVERMEALLDRAGGPGMLFDADRADPQDRVVAVGSVRPADSPGTWIIGDLHGDLLALEAALALIRDRAATEGTASAPRIVFLGDLFDDGGFGLELLLRVFELILEAPQRICIVTGNHDEALSYDGVRFASSVSPSDFSDFLNAHLSHEWIERAGKVAVRLFAQTPRALFMPDGLLVTHGGFPLVDLHARLAEGGDWNDPACLADFTWARLHPKARRKMPNRHSRGSQFGHEDFADFCALSAALGRPVTCMVRGHDHIEERWAVPDAYRAHPVLTTVALSRRLDREQFGPRERAPTVARAVEGALPQVHRLHVPAAMIHELYPEPDGAATEHVAAATEPRG